LRRSWYLKRLTELHALAPLSQMKMLEAVWEFVKEYDDLLRVEIGEKQVMVGVRRFNHGSKERFIVNHRVSRIAVPLLEELMPDAGDQAEERDAERSC